MIQVTRSPKNPILTPNPANDWEANAVFNPSVIKENDSYHILYRAMSSQRVYFGQNLSLSTIGYAKSTNGKDFSERSQLITPEHEWEKYGCEDPRITKLDNQYFIFYTALSGYPPQANSIKIGLAISLDLKNIREKHLVTPFNAKAMTLFPKKINEKYTAILTVNTDIPPAKIAIAQFDKKEDLWSTTYWQNWYQNLDQHLVNLQRINSDQLEVGAVPLGTDSGWLLIYAHILNYNTPEERIFGVETVLLDNQNPQRIIGRTEESIIVPQEKYELEGNVPRVTFPSGALIEKDRLLIYYGAADESCALAECQLEDLINQMKANKTKVVLKLKKFDKNPILQPDPGQPWKEKSVFNPTAVREGGKTYLIYRAMSEDNTSTLGCAISDDGFNFDQKLHEPVYFPRLRFERKKKKQSFSGCEDPRITKIGKKFYMLYTAYDGFNPPRVALSSIPVDDFITSRWLWSAPVLISPPDMDDKNACILPERIGGNYVVFHRVGGKEIAVDYVKSLKFDGNKWLGKVDSIPIKPESWDSEKIGTAGVPIKTEAGWLLFYHGVSRIDKEYRIGFMILDYRNPAKVLFRTKYPVLEPTAIFERQGDTDNVVFPCGTILVGDTVFVYYGGADNVICVATAKLQDLLLYATEGKY